MPTSGFVVRVSLATGLGTPDHLKICEVEAAHAAVVWRDVKLTGWWLIYQALIIEATIPIWISKGNIPKGAPFSQRRSRCCFFFNFHPRTMGRCQTGAETAPQLKESTNRHQTTDVFGTQIITPWKTKWKSPSWKGNSSSKPSFLGCILIFRGVHSPY